MLQSKSIGNKIAAARKRMNLSQAELSEHISISSQAVGKWERGESMPDISTLNRLAEILGVDLNYFSDNFPSTSTESVTSEPSISGKSDKLQTVKQKQCWDMSQGSWVNADFSGLKNLQEKFGTSNIKNCKFVGSEMSGLVLKTNHVDTCNFSNSNLNNSNIQASHIVHSIFKNCSLKDAVFSSSHIKNCNFEDAEFSGLSIKSSSFVANKVEGATWTSVSFHSSEISNVVLGGEINDCSFEYCSFSKVTFKNATLKNTFFKCKTLKQIVFIDCKADRITYEFLKNGKANLKGIEIITE